MRDRNILGPPCPAHRYERPTTRFCKRPVNGWIATLPGNGPGISELPLAPSGSEFRREVWRILCGIPYGEVMTYGEIGKRVAAEMGRKSMSAQAVGGAVGHNPISILIPCHRVVGSDGSLTGYAGGLVRKRRLLELEGVNLSRLFVPSVGTAL